MLIRLIQRFFSDRSFPTSVKVPVYLLTMLFLTAAFFVYRAQWLRYEEWRLILYAFHLLIFATTYFCGFLPGLSYALLSSTLAALVLSQGVRGLETFTVGDLEIFPFLTFYFLVALAVDWFRQNIEQLQEQMEENRRLQEQARHMEKLALAGEIAAGIAHEIRNPLTVIQGYLQFIAGKCQKQCNSEESFEMLQQELKRANQIISDFLRFSRPDKPRKVLSQLNEIIETAASLLYGESLRTGVQILLYPAPDLPQVSLDRDQLIQVFLNLFSNAIQAMPDGGTVSVYTAYDKNTELITVRTTDSGIGMSKDTVERVFSPFYTTKDDGTGLGLAITQSIILAHGGRIGVDSSPGEGTSFTIVLPVSAC